MINSNWEHFGTKMMAQYHKKQMSFKKIAVLIFRLCTITCAESEQLHRGSQNGCTAFPGRKLCITYLAAAWWTAMCRKALRHI